MRSPRVPSASFVVQYSSRVGRAQLVGAGCRLYHGKRTCQILHNEAEVWALHAGPKHLDKAVAARILDACRKLQFKAPHVVLIPGVVHLLDGHLRAAPHGAVHGAKRASTDPVLWAQQMPDLAIKVNLEVNCPRALQKLGTALAGVAAAGKGVDVEVRCEAVQEARVPMWTAVIFAVTAVQQVDESDDTGADGQQQETKDDADPEVGAAIHRAAWWGRMVVLGASPDPGIHTAHRLIERSERFHVLRGWAIQCRSSQKPVQSAASKGRWAARQCQWDQQHSAVLAMQSQRTMAA